ncbi:MAG: phosphorylase, partial [Verrucomicrobiota bacterium]
MLGLVVALRSEGRALFGGSGWSVEEGRTSFRAGLADGTGLLCVQSGPGLENAFLASRWLVSGGATALAVLGVSGGLDPSLSAGDLVVAETVLEERGRGEIVSWRADPRDADLLRDFLRREGIPARRGAVVTVRRPVRTPGEKRALRERSGALAVDMESAAVARAAAEARLPFLSLRAVCDPADRAVPSDLHASLADDGSLRLSLLARKLLMRPFLISDALRLGREFATAL